MSKQIKNKEDLDFNKISEFEGPGHSPGFLLWQVSTSWRRKIETKLSEYNLTHSQFVILAVLGWLTRNGDNINQAALAKYSKLDINMTSQVMRRLEKSNLISREYIEGDERSKYAKPTKEGKKLIKKVIPVVEEVDREFFRNIDLTTRNNLLNTFRVLVK